MGEFIASNGIPVQILPNGHLQTMNADHTYPSAIAAGEHVEALREFFQQERDEALGRWRWPENPDYVVYPEPNEDFERMFGPGLDAVILRESDGMTKGYVRAEDENAPARWVHLSAARAYFNAHPEPKPWHEAVAGEVWVISVHGGDEFAALVETFDDTFVFQVPDAESITTTRDAVTSGRRIWPEVS